MSEHDAMKQPKKRLKNMELSLTKVRKSLLKLRWRTTVLSFLLLSISLTMFSPIKTVKGLLVDTGLVAGTLEISMDASRVAWIDSSNVMGHNVFVYDINSGTYTSFPGPNGVPGGSSFGGAIYGDKIVAAGNLTALLSPFTATVSYCILPHVAPMQPCGPWKLLATGLPQIAKFTGYGPPAIHGDVVAWWTTSGFAYHSFDSNATQTVTFTAPQQPVGLSTNGEIIAFTLAQNPGQGKFGYCGPLEYLDITNEAQGVINTGLTSCAQNITPNTSISQYTIAFTDNSTGPNRVRYYDYLRNQPSAAGQGPLGNLTFLDNSAIWTNRILFSASETGLNFDCDGDGQIQPSQGCLQYWNIRSPSYVAPFLAAKAAPGLSGAFAIYDKTIAFKGSNGNLQYVTVPMQGDVDQDGAVDATDKTLVINCLGQVLKGTVC
jgi:hypothetical protein